MKLCSRPLMAFCRHFCEKPQIWISEPHFGEVRGDARPWLMTRWKVHVDFLFAFGAMRRNVYNSAVFIRVDFFAVKFYLDRVVSDQPLLASEN